MLTHLCQPRKLPTREACEAEATLSPLVTCEYVWHNRTRVCDLREPGSTSSARSSRSSHAREALHRCIRSHRTRGSSLVNVTRPLDGGVAIVESMTSNMFSAAGVPLKEEHQRTTHNIRCWAARHNYSLILNGVSLAELRQGYSTAYGPRRLWGGVPFDKINDVRHRVTRQALERYEAVLHIDTDTIALNENRSLRRHLHGPGLMTFQIREMCASITRAHTPRGRGWGRGCTHTRRNNARRLTFRPRAHAPPHPDIHMHTSSCSMYVAPPCAVQPSPPPDATHRMRSPAVCMRAVERSPQPRTWHADRPRLPASSIFGTRWGTSRIGTHGRCSTRTTG